MRLLIAALLALILAPCSHAQPRLEAGVTDDIIEVTSDFRGARITIFGATSSARADVVVAVRGPSAPVTLYRKRQVLGVWINADPVAFVDAPSFFAVISARPLAEVASPALIARHALDPAVLAELGGPTPADADPSSYRAALVRLKRSRGLYIENPRGLLRDGSLFKAQVRLPATAPPGTYSVRVFLIARGRVASIRETAIMIRREGVEATVYGLAKDRPILYGMATVALALGAGWVAAALTRRS